jgi:hypothetical protein
MGVVVAPDDEDLDIGGIQAAQLLGEKARPLHRDRLAVIKSPASRSALTCSSRHTSTIREKTWRLALPTNSASRGSRRASERSGEAGAQHDAGAPQLQ